MWTSWCSEPPPRVEERSLIPICAARPFEEVIDTAAAIGLALERHDNQVQEVV